jgi:hypothetical protein
MLRFALAGSLALLASIVPVSAQTEPPTSDTVTGTAAGRWDLPNRTEAGRFRGMMVQDGKRRFLVEGTLIPLAMPTGERGGRIDGVLVPITPDGIGTAPVAGLHGTFLVRPGGYGTFEAMIYDSVPMLGARPEVIGKMAGRFADPWFPGEDRPGRFLARWAMRR